MECFYVPSLEEGALHVVLEHDEMHHLRVLRCRIGDRVMLTSGRGLRATGHITSVDRHHALVSIETIEHYPGELPYELTIAVGILSAHERMEWLVEKCTELGVCRIQPVQTELAELRHLRRPERLHAKMIAALKQSQRSVLPTLADPVPLGDVIARASGVVVVCDPAGDAPIPPMAPCTIIVGPEGGFSRSEQQLLDRAGCVRWSLGRLRLRSETAAIAAASIIATQWSANYAPRSDRTINRARGT
jgi:16S rRNA (uracil1498-N3)-methyltransferase